MSLSDENSMKYIENYIRQLVWLKPINSFNDPFEGHFIARNNDPETVINTSHDSFLEIYRELGCGLTQEEFRDFVISEPFKDVYASINTHKSIFDYFGALCMTNTADNIPMWAYYGDNHEGCCIEFKIDIEISKKQNKEKTPGDWHDKIVTFKTSREIICGLIKVKYKKKKPWINYRFISDERKSSSLNKQKHIVFNSFGTKYLEWSHENEYRLFSNLNSVEAGLLHLPQYFPFLKVTGIILGSKISNDNSVTIKKLCKENQIQIYYAKCSKDTFKITVNENE